MGDKQNEVEINASQGSQIINAGGNSVVNIVQNNGMEKNESDNILEKTDINLEETLLNRIKNKISRKIGIRTVLRVSVAIALFLLVSYYLNLYYTYNHYINKANRLKENHKFLEAAENYKIALGKAEKMFFDRGRLVKAACKEADCYLVLGLEENDSDIAYQYYAKAGGKYGKIINDKRNESTDLYVEALAGLSYVYNYTEHTMDEEWRLLISQIEEEVKGLDKIDVNIKSSNKLDEENLYRLMKIYSALGDYYYTEIQIDYSFMLKPEILCSALNYYEKYNALFKLASEKDKEISMLIDSIYCARVRAELLILLAASPYVKNSDQCANHAIDLCQTYLGNASFREMDIESYISFKYNIGKGYYELGKYYKKEEKKSNEYMKKAYDEFVTLLNLKSDEVKLDQMIDVGYSAIFTGFCTNGDLKKY